ncbi:MAG: alginate export family protein, partial [Planctomycetota bacterium]
TDGGFTITPSLYQGYVTGVGSEYINMDTLVGRFEASYGDEYVIGDNDFYAAGLSWDGVVLSKDWAANGFSLDVIYSKIVEGYKTGANGVDDNIYLFALMGNWYGSSDSTGTPGAVEPYYILLKDNSDVPGSPSLGGVNTKDIHTTGLRWYGDKSNEEDGGIEWNVNANHQYSFNHEFSADAVVRYNMSDTKWSPTLWGQAAYASGDQNNFLEAYNPLFMDVHGRFGYSDFWTFSNLMVGGIGAEIHPREDLTYGISGRSIHFARTPAPSTSRSLAWQFEFYVLHEMTENVSLEAAWSYIKWRGGSATTGLDDVQRGYINLLVAF